MISLIRFFFLFILLLSNSCSQQSLDGYREETQGILRSLTETLKHVHNREELLQAESRLKKLFDNLTDIIIEAQEYIRKKPGADSQERPLNYHSLNDEFLNELNRVCLIEGGREIVEKCQQESLDRLDAYVKKGLRAKG